MQNIQMQVVKMFAKNMEFLSAYNENLYKKLAILQQAMQSGQYQQNYALEYVDGYFDVQNLHDKSWLYGSNSDEFSQKKADNINLKKSQASISLTYKNSFTKAMASDFDKLSAINTPGSITAPLEYAIERLGGRKESMRKIFKFVFFGVGLGLHIEKIAQKIKAKHYLIIEDNLELFYLSLFVCDYETISKTSTLHFSIMDSQSDFKRVYDTFFYNEWIQNDFLKFSLFDDSYAHKIKHIQSLLTTNPALTYPFSLSLKKNLNVSRILNNGYKFLNISKFYQQSPLKDKKVLFLAAGPSLDAYMDWVKKNKEHFIIIAVFMISAKLKANGIKPDIFIHADENYEPIQNTLKKFDNFSYFEDITFLLSSSIPLNLFEKIAKKEDIYLLQDATHYKAGFGNLEFYSIGEAGYSLSLILGANELYLLGLDLALDQKTGQTHSTGHNSSNDQKDLDSANSVEEVSSLKDSVLYVKANRGGKVKTTPLFEISIHMMNEISKNLEYQRVFNLGDGAYFEQIQPLKVSEVTFDKKADKHDIKNFLNDNSEDSLNQKDINNFTIRRQEVKKKVKSLRKFYQSKTENSTELLMQFLTLINQLVKTPDPKINEIKLVFTSYTLFVGGFLSEYFNTKDADFSKEAILRIKKILHDQIGKIFYGISLWDFNLLSKDKFPAPLVCKDIEDEVFSFSLKYSNHSQIKEICFSEKLKADKDSKLLENVELKPLEEKSGVGFLATFENLNNKEHIEYLKKILKEIDGATLVAFYFEEYQKVVAQDTFKEFTDKLTCKEVRGLEDIVNGCRVYCYNLDLPDRDFGIVAYLYNLVNNSSVELFMYWVSKKRNACKVEELDRLLNLHLDEKHLKLGLDSTYENGENVPISYIYFYNALKKMGHKDIKFDFENFGEFNLKVVFNYALKSDDFIRILNSYSKAKF